MSFKVPDGGDVWVIAHRTNSYTYRMLNALSGTVQIDDHRITSTDGSTIARTDLDFARVAFREHHLTPHHGWSHFDYSVAGERSAGSASRVQIDVWFWFDGEVQVDLASDSKIALDGLKAKLEAEVEYLISGKDNLSEPHVIVDSPRQDVSPATADQPSPGPSDRRSKQQGWFARTWRDHTAAFVTTVLGGVVVAVLIAWLRLGSL
ncbi:MULTISPECIES: hypothetical protein [unclassified Microbacterium]|uniref:hypothetical protein n=1 Tax=Microbacterium TaxID=33882 RepID=UPI003BA37738